MKSQDIRQSFIDFFRDQGHQEVASSPLVPHGDPTLMFTNAGMVQFKDYFLGLEKPESPRAVSVQKCLRVSGKHNDLENVGPSPRHHTFFEMLGNFSFGDYFKEDAIRFGWDLVTGPWGLDPAHLFATVYEEDDEAAELWAKISSLPAERILRCGKADNFWQMGDTGPCGPCSEIFVDRHPELPAVKWEEGSENGRYLEIWNLVFMQFNRDESGKLTPLPKGSIDTGAGLERVTAVLQGVESNYDTDLFQPILKAVADLAGTEYGRDPQADTSMRVIADHLRAVSFLLADGVIAGPDGRGYVLRRLLRRAVRHGMLLGFEEEPFLHLLVPTLGKVMGHHYRELVETHQSTETTILAEEEKFRKSRGTGVRLVQEAINQARQNGESILSGEVAFNLYETHGQDLDTQKEIAEEERFQIDEDGFHENLKERQDTGRTETEKKQKRLRNLREALHTGGEATIFEGYDQYRLDKAKVTGLALTDNDNKEKVAKAVALEAGQTGVTVLDKTVFYAEAGGQLGDHGSLVWEGGRARVSDTQKDTTGIYFHSLEVVEGELAIGQEVELCVDTDRRLAIERHHTGTHLLHAALHQVLGKSAQQAGSLVAPERLRFDFKYNQPLTAQQIEEIERIVNEWVLKAVSTEIRWRSREEAMADGAMALFGEKYGDQVRTVEIPGFSFELCGGCHVRNTGEIGPLLVTGERGTASGVRRIEAITGGVAMDELRRRDQLLRDVERGLGVDAERAPQEAEDLKSRIKELERETARLRQELVAGKSSGSEENEVAGIKFVAREVPKAPTGELRNLADTLRDKLGSGVVVLGSKSDGKVSVIVTVSKDLTKRLNAGRLVKELAAVVGGSGGGRPDFAQAGGKDPDQLPRLFEKVPEVLESQLS